MGDGGEVGMVLITGGAGYIGSHANLYFNEKGEETVVLDNLSRGHKECVICGKFIKGDIFDSELLDKIFTEHKIDAVLHFAAFAYVGESVEKPAIYYRNNVAGTVNLLDAMVRHGVKNIVFSSTCATYGVPDKMPITEDAEQKPINPYGESKLMVERIISDYALSYGLHYCVFRYFNAAGADSKGRIGEWHEPETHIIPRILDAAASLRDGISIFGTDYPTRDGTCIRDYIHVTDLADAHYRAYKHLLSGGESAFLNLGTGEGVSIRELVKTVEQITGRKVKVSEAQRRPGDPPELVGGGKKAKAVLDWEAKRSDIETVIRDAWAYHEKPLVRAKP